MSNLEQLKTKIKEKLPDLDMVIGWEQGFDPLRTNPLFMRTEEDVDKMMWGPLCVHNLATYLPGLKGKKVGIVVKGCDSRSIIELLQEKLINRDDVTIFTIPCEGVISIRKIQRIVGTLDYVEAVETGEEALRITVDGQAHKLWLKDISASKCERCQHHNALVSDVFIGDPIEESAEDDYSDVTEFEAQSNEEKLAFWFKEMDRCVRCYACRNACPMCVCRDHCVAQSRDPHWITQEDTVQNKWFFQMIHAMHLAGRCTECGECERACPVGIPLLLLKRKLNKEINTLFDYKAGTIIEATPPLQAFKVEEDNINERGW
ncbi:4Fe-4S dicluster domain-containing protein [Pseudodesulfovibrio piezophilus]|uniref:4Fe-4S ferredoxin iron-sulfur binding domain protein n=1 Tax=Pseudodesulfovibrio piezophilus (strain DSM 21447 / JCM 15486 / C1TLV30) TaxID=1322246 RepID=M1WST8_PSEP2|nr:4Fe-4S dicluster domain-containing protein [Pseudodesulfovibrio piezophilus]CCH49097.1 4Fe-4S ferredoxin iron-sulfur binding domain protein [Pseudodesulfovibrio piezophilus C1TLV30]